MNEQVGVRELRQGLSKYLRRVRRGERLVVTERNRPVAILGPLPEQDDPLERLITEGRATGPARDDRDFQPLEIDLGDPHALSRSLDGVRGDR